MIAYFYYIYIIYKYGFGVGRKWGTFRPEFSVLFLNCKTSARVQLAKTGYGKHVVSSSLILD